MGTQDSPRPCPQRPLPGQWYAYAEVAGDGLRVRIAVRRHRDEQSIPETLYILGPPWWQGLSAALSERGDQVFRDCVERGMWNAMKEAERRNREEADPSSKRLTQIEQAVLDLGVPWMPRS